MRSIFRIALVAAFLAVPFQSHAGYLGHSVGLTFEFDENGLVPVGSPPPPFTVVSDFGTQTVGAGVEFPAAGAGVWNVDVSDTAIRFTLSDLAGPAWFNVNTIGFRGYRLRDFGGSLPDIVGVSIASDAFVGLNSSRVSFDADSILIDFNGFFIEHTGLVPAPFECFPTPPPAGISQCVHAGDLVRVFQPEFVLNVEFAAVPEPVSSALLGLGLAALGFSRRRMVKK